jgi:tRNA-Thr(GGU) m(6)t(6)A37 methyltransferase TsaA
MPLLEVYTAQPLQADEISFLSMRLAQLFSVPHEMAWVYNFSLSEKKYYRGLSPNNPVALLHCRESHSAIKAEFFLSEFPALLSDMTNTPKSQVYCAVRRILNHEVVSPFAQEPVSPPLQTLTFQPIGYVQSPRRSPEDDEWGKMRSTILLDTRRFTSQALRGLEEFSHVEIIFYMHLVNPQKIEVGARHPRNNRSWPEVGIFAQRGKNRPNQIAVSRCRILKVDGSELHIEALDAVDGSPVLDIKPYMQGFAPREVIHEPKWATEIMTEYYKEPSDEQ